MMTTSSRITMNAQSGAAGKIHTCVDRVQHHQEHAHPASPPGAGQKPAAGEHEDDGEDHRHPAPGGEVGDDRPVASDHHDLSLTTAARP